MKVQLTVKPSMHRSNQLIIKAGSCYLWMGCLNFISMAGSWLEITKISTLKTCCYGNVFFLKLMLLTQVIITPSLISVWSITDFINILEVSNFLYVCMAVGQYVPYRNTNIWENCLLALLPYKHMGKLLTSRIFNSQFLAIIDTAGRCNRHCELNLARLTSL